MRATVEREATLSSNLRRVCHRSCIDAPCNQHLPPIYKRSDRGNSGDVKAGGELHASAARVAVLCLCETGHGSRAFRAFITLGVLGLSGYTPCNATRHGVFFLARDGTLGELR